MHLNKVFYPAVDFYYAPWQSRLTLAKQLLSMVTRFTENDLEIALYLTDWNSDNFAVDEDLKIRIVDGENFILVDQRQLEEQQSPGFDVEHCSDGFGCRNRICYSSEDLCTHVRSDHNVYGLCKGLLSTHAHSKTMPKGLLHSIPEGVLRRQPLLPRLLKECAMPTHPGGRFEAVQQLLEILRVV